MPSPREYGNDAESTRQYGAAGALMRLWQRTYAPDYIGFAILLTAYILIQLKLEPFHRLFSLDNANIMYPHALVERVPLGYMFLYAGGVPLVFMLTWLLVSRSSVHKIHVTMLGFFISLVLTSFITDVVKNAVGRPRPDLLDRCKPRAGTPERILVDFEVCTEMDHHILHDGWRSFPSGHSSFAFAGLGFLTLWLCGQLRVFRPRTDLTKGLLAFSPLLGAAMIAISRCEDYRHDVYDVTAGSVLGMSVTYFSYRRYYPILGDTDCEVPFSSSAEADRYGKAGGDEEALMHPGNFDLDEFEAADEA